MIKATVSIKDNKYDGFTCSGHAGYADYGKDIVCASVSSIVITSCNLALRFNKNSISPEIL